MDKKATITVEAEPDNPESPVSSRGHALVIAPQKSHIISYELAGILRRRPSQAIRRDKTFDHVMGPHNRYIGITAESFLRISGVQTDEQAAISHYEEGGNPISFTRETGISLLLAEKIWTSYQRLNNDKNVQAAKAARGKIEAVQACIECQRTPRQRAADAAINESRQVESAPKCGTCGNELRANPRE